MRPLAALFGIAALAACTAPTPYQPITADHRNGFADAQISSDRYRVAFNGNSQTSRETVDLYLLYRAAEVTLANGADSFVITNRDTATRTSYVSTGAGAGHPRFRPSGGSRLRSGAFGTFDPVQSIPVRQYEAFAEIRTFVGAAPEGSDAYDARDVIASLESKISE